MREIRTSFRVPKGYRHRYVLRVGDGVIEVRMVPPNRLQLRVKNQGAFRGEEYDWLGCVIERIKQEVGV